MRTTMSGNKKHLISHLHFKEAKKDSTTMLNDLGRTNPGTVFIDGQDLHDISLNSDSALESKAEYDEDSTSVSSISTTGEHPKPDTFGSRLATARKEETKLNTLKSNMRQIIEEHVFNRLRLSNERANADSLYQFFEKNFHQGGLLYSSRLALVHALPDHNLFLNGDNRDVEATCHLKTADDGRFLITSTTTFNTKTLMSSEIGKTDDGEPYIIGAPEPILNDQAVSFSTTYQVAWDAGKGDWSYQLTKAEGKVTKNDTMETTPDLDGFLTEIKRASANPETSLKKSIYLCLEAAKNTYHKKNDYTSWFSRSLDAANKLLETRNPFKEISVAQAFTFITCRSGSAARADSLRVLFLKELVKAKLLSVNVDTLTGSNDNIIAAAKSLVTDHKSISARVLDKETEKLSGDYFRTSSDQSVRTFHQKIEISHTPPSSPFRQAHTHPPVTHGAGAAAGSDR